MFEISYVLLFISIIVITILGKDVINRFKKSQFLITFFITDPDLDLRVWVNFWVLIILPKYL